jgi:hypothetical protein
VRRSAQARKKTRKKRFKKAENGLFTISVSEKMWYNTRGEKIKRRDGEKKNVPAFLKRL